MNIKLIAENTSLDLRAEESIKIVDSIQDARNLSSITTAYSQQFNLPATAKNNIYFKKFENSDVTNGFDARFKVDASITIGGFTFKKGKLRLNGVSLENGEVRSYKVVFFGESIEFKDLIGDDLLSSLDLSDYDHSRDDLTVIDGLTNGLGLGGSISATPQVIYPLISPIRQFKYDSTNGFVALKDFEGNNLLVNDIEARVTQRDLKPAIQLKVLIDAIADKYGFVWQSNFFNSFNFKQLFLWLHRNEGEILVNDAGNEVGTFTNSIDDLILNSGSDLRPLTSDGADDYYRFIWTINYAGTSSYTVRAVNTNTGDILAEATNPNGGNDIVTWEIGQELTTGPEGIQIDFILDATDAITITQSLEVEYYIREEFEYQIANNSFYDFPTNDVTDLLRLRRIVPELKIFDFLRILFKMFNLTAYKENDEIVIEPLPDYYENPKVWDITQYVDWDKKQVDRLFPYSSVFFGWKGRETFLLKNRDEITGLRFGDLDFNGNANFDGDPFKIEVDAEKMLYERLNDENGNQSNVIYGWSVDNRKEPYLTKPLIFYRRKRQLSGDTIQYVAEDGTKTNITTYNAPSNTEGNDDYTINFGPEIDEFSLITNENSLFLKFYRDYISTIYNKRARRVTLKAFLPLNIILNYQLRDVVIIQNKRYRINKISTNVITGQSDLELWTDLNTPSLINNNSNPDGIQPEEAEIEATTITENQITLSWNTGLGASSVTTSLDGKTDKTGVTYATGSYDFTGLEPDTTYKLGIRLDGTNVNSQPFYIKVTTLPLTGTPLSGTFDDDVADFSTVDDTFDLE